MQQNHFKQLVKEPTHIEGNLLDHAYILDTQNVHKYTAVLHSKYYTDHRGLGITVKRLVFELIFNILFQITYYSGKLNDEVAIPRMELDNKRTHHDNKVIFFLCNFICQIIEI